MSGVLSRCINANHSLYLKIAGTSNSYDLYKSHSMSIIQNMLSFVPNFLPVPYYNYYLSHPVAIEFTITVTHSSILHRF